MRIQSCSSTFLRPRQRKTRYVACMSLQGVVSHVALAVQKKAAKDTLRAEEARIQLRHMDLELCREQAKASARFERPAYPPGYPQPYPPHAAPATHHQSQIAPHTAHPQPYPYYSLAPVQQQVLARFQQPPQHAPGQQQAPASPSMPYPHSAHPLCPPPADEKNLASRLPHLRQPSPSAAGLSEETKKRSRASISSPNEGEQQDKLRHTKVMEALKAKIQRGNGGPLSPLTAPPIRPPPSASTSTPSQEHPNKKKKPALPRPVVVHQADTTASSPSPSPRSAKPVLPPIDTNLGRMDTVTKATTTTTTRIVAKSDTDSTSSAASSNSSGHQETSKNEDTRQQRQKDAKSSIDIDSTASPSDHILQNTRRARSLSPPSTSSSSSSSASSPVAANISKTASATKKITS